MILGMFVTSPFSGGSPLPNVLVTMRTSNIMNDRYLSIFWWVTIAKGAGNNEN